MRSKTIRGARSEFDVRDDMNSGGYPMDLRRLYPPPRNVYMIGNSDAIEMPCIGIVGPRKEGGEDIGLAAEFARIAVENGFGVVSAGEVGIDASVHRATIESGGVTVAVLAGGLDNPSPHENQRLFQNIVDAGGVLVSDQKWSSHAMPFASRNRYRIVAGLSEITVIIGAGHIASTYAAADTAIGMGRVTVAVPARDKMDDGNDMFEDGDALLTDPRIEIVTDCNGFKTMLSRVNITRIP